MKNEKFYLSLIFPVLIALIIFLLRKLPISKNVYVSLALSIISILLLVYFAIYLLKGISKSNKFNSIISIILIIIFLFSIWFEIMDISSIFF